MAVDSYSTVDVTGDDAFDFLQAQLAADLRDMGIGERRLSAWCNPKGRVISLLRVVRNDDGFSLLLPTELAEPVVQRLTKFRFRSRVAFSVKDLAPEQLGASAALGGWQIDNLRAGIVEIGLPQSELFTPHMLNLDLLDAVSLDKGCYPGQEIVSRTHYRGATKRRCLRFDSATPATSGDKVSDASRVVGEVVNAIGTELLAVIAVDSADSDLTIDGKPLSPLPLPYLDPPDGA